MKNFIEEFKKFALRGNVVDLAVAVVIGGAFGKIVSSLTEDIIMPILGILTGGIDFSTYSVTLKSAKEGSEAIVLTYGVFLNAIISFLIISFAIFMIIKVMNTFIQKHKETEAKKVVPSREEELLAEIRDLLKKDTV